MKITQSSLNKLEKIFTESGYILRYERGAFQSGWCLLEARKIVILNKFLDLEARINTLQDILPQVQIVKELLSPESQKLYQEFISPSESAESKKIY